MISLLLLIAQASSQETPTPPIYAFSSSNTMTGEVCYKQADATMINVNDASALRLRATLKVLTGEAHLVAMTEVAGAQKVWTSENVGDDEIVIGAADPSFTDGLGIRRSFLFAVAGVSQETAQYSLTIKTESAALGLSAFPVSLHEIMRDVSAFNLQTMNLFEGTIASFTKTQTMKGELSKMQTTALLIAVTDNRVKQLRATLKLTYGDCDLFAVAEVNTVQQHWMSTSAGNEEIVIRANDAKFTDGKKLLRQFVFVVLGMSQASTYELTVVAENAYTNRMAMPAAIASFVAGQDTLDLVAASEPISTFAKSQTMTGEVKYKQADAMLISVQDSTTSLLHFKLNVYSGNADLVVITNVNNAEAVWQSVRAGSDEITIRANDRQLKDGKGLLRDFVIVVVGVSNQVSSYELVVTAKTAATSVVALPQSITVLPEFQNLPKSTQMTAFPEPISAFGKVHVMTGDVPAFDYDTYLIEVKDPTVQQLRFKLTVFKGDADLIVYAKNAGATDIMWTSMSVGSDQVVIRGNDAKITDSQGLTRDFMIMVIGASMETASYELKITAESSVTAVYELGEDMKAWTEQYEAESGELSAWWMLSAVAAVVAGGLWVWSDSKGSRRKSSKEYVLL